LWYASYGRAARDPRYAPGRDGGGGAGVITSGGHSLAGQQRAVDGRAADDAVIALPFRLTGKRGLASLSMFDFVVIFLLSNVVQDAIIGNDTSHLCWGHAPQFRPRRLRPRR
jgi:hypothetical protein